jgi:hypothetical protein
LLGRVIAGVFIVACLGATAMPSPTLRATAAQSASGKAPHAPHVAKPFKGHHGKSDKPSGPIDANIGYSTTSSGHPPAVYHGGPVQHNPVVYLVFWGPGNYSAPTFNAMQSFVGSLSGSGWGNILTQYGVNNNIRLGGVWVDPVAPSGPIDAAGGPSTFGEANRAVALTGWPVNGDANVMVLPQPGSNVPGEGTAFCGWHSTAWSYQFSLIPFPGAGCLTGDPTQNIATAVASHEIAETATDPNFNAWYTDVDGSLGEIGDLCAWELLPINGGTTQQLYSNRQRACMANYSVSSPSVAPEGSTWEGTFQANTVNEWVVGGLGTGDQGLGMWAGTSPAFTNLGNNVNQWMSAFVANTGQLWITGSYGTWNSGYYVNPGSSPAITALPNGGWEVAFQGWGGNLWVYGSGGTGNTGLGMYAGSSPSITPLWASSGYEVAFEANTTRLWVYGSAGTGDLGYGMYPGTNPSITWRVGGGYETAFQANTSRLWYAGTSQTYDTGLGMFAGASPSITTTGYGYDVAFQANTANLWLTGASGTRDTGLGMMPASNPSLKNNFVGGNLVAFQANTGNLWVMWNNVPYDQWLGMYTG